MRTIIHLSDLHFGRVEEVIANQFVRRVMELKPHLVVISGDLTQRAGRTQFQAARQFLDRLPQPQIVVPGNNDVPIFNFFERFLDPLKKYRLDVGRDLLPSYIDQEIAVFGLNSARSFTINQGKLRDNDVAYVCGQLRKFPANVVRVVVCHHPFDVPVGHTDRDLIRNSAKAMRAFAECHVDVILSGHLHRSHSSQAAVRYGLPGRSALIVQAGTAISNVYRGEGNSFNVLRFQDASLIVERLGWNPKAADYTLLKTEEFRRADKGWDRRKSLDVRNDRAM